MANQTPARPAGVPDDATFQWGRWLQGVKTNGKLEGRWRTWSGEGVLIADLFYEGGIQNGPYRNFHPDGTLAEEGVYKSGAFADGEHVRYAQKGDKKFRPFQKAVGEMIVKAVGVFSSGKMTETHYFDAEGIERGAKGKAVDKAVAKKEKASAPSDAEKLAAFLAKK